MTRELLYIGILFSALSCGTTGPRIRTGDLLFQAGAEAPITEAIAAATGDRRPEAEPQGKEKTAISTDDQPVFTHVGIAIVCGDSIQVLEAAGEGVRYTSLEAFLCGSQLRQGKPAVTVMRLRDTTGVAEAVRRAEGFVGQPYDYSYLPANDKMYCSELVYESYLAPDGTHRFTARPMNFRAADGTLPRFWTELFDRLGESVPEGIPGTNPNDLAQDEALERVGSFF